MAAYLAEAERPALVSPTGRQPRGQTHQGLGGELLALAAVDDRRDDVGHQLGEAQDRVKVGRRQLLRTRDDCRRAICCARAQPLKMTLRKRYKAKPK